MSTAELAILPNEGRFLIRFWMPTRMSCLIPFECLAARLSSACGRGDGLRDLILGGRDDEIEEEAERDDDAGVVQEHADHARDARAVVEELHSGPHRGGDDQAEEEQGDQQLDLPEGERQGTTTATKMAEATRARRAVCLISVTSCRLATSAKPRAVRMPCEALDEHVFGHYT